jgi:hypothetical protein
LSTYFARIIVELADKIVTVAAGDICLILDYAFSASEERFFTGARKWRPGTRGLSCRAAALLTALVYPAIRDDAVFFNRENQFLPKVHLQSNVDADVHGGDGFAHNAARQRDLALTDRNEQHHRFAEPARIRMRGIFNSLSDHVGQPLYFRGGTDFL